MAPSGKWRKRLDLSYMFVTTTPVSMFWGVACLLITVPVQLGLVDERHLYLAGTIPQLSQPPHHASA